MRIASNGMSFSICRFNHISADASVDILVAAFIFSPILVAESATFSKKISIEFDRMKLENAPL